MLTEPWLAWVLTAWFGGIGVVYLVEFVRLGRWLNRFSHAMWMPCPIAMLLMCWPVANSVAGAGPWVFGMIAACSIVLAVIPQPYHCATAVHYARTHAGFHAFIAVSMTWLYLLSGYLATERARVHTASGSNPNLAVVGERDADALWQLDAWVVLVTFAVVAGLLVAGVYRLSLILADRVRPGDRRTLMNRRMELLANTALAVGMAFAVFIM